MLVLSRVLFIFIKTFGYYLRSLWQPSQITELKQTWALGVMRDFGYEMSVKGMAPLQGPLILVGNHISYLDILFLMAIDPDVVFIAKKEIKSWPVIGIAAERVGTIFVNREASADKQNKRADITRILKQRSAKVVVFPSGTTALNEDKAWKKGAFEIAKEGAIKVKAFKISYTPLRESAYIDDDNLLKQMALAFKTKNKVASLTWLDEYHIDSPIDSAATICEQVVNAI